MQASAIVKRTWRVAVVLAIALTVATVYLSQGRANAAGGQAPTFTAVELSDALLFNEGKAAPYLASLDRGVVPWDEATRAGQKAINSTIDQNPRWAAAFRANLQSGDPNRVAKALHDLSALARSSLIRTLGEATFKETVDRIIGDAFTDSAYVIIINKRVIPYNFIKPLQYPCCLETYIDIITISILVSYLSEVWQLDGIAGQVSKGINELVTGTVAGALWSAAG